MNRNLFALVLLGLSSVSSAQALRAGARAQVISVWGTPSQTSETDWTVATVLTRSAEAHAGGGHATSTFTSAFGVLKGRTYAETSGTGPITSTASGTFADFNNFVGAAFFDRITLVGASSIRINYSFHTFNEDPNANTLAETEFKFDTFSSIPTNTFNVAKFVHSGAGNHTNSGSVVINGPGGHTFDLLVAMSSFSNSRLADGVTDSYFARSDATNTAMVTIEPLSGSFTSASGSTYAAPVPEPASLATIALGLGALAGRRRKH